MGYGGYGNLGGCCCDQTPPEPFECTGCEGDEGPYCWKVTISGVALGGGPPGKNNNINGVHYLTPAPPTFPAPVPPTFLCHWECRQSFTPLSVPPLASVHLWVTQSSGAYFLNVGVAGTLMNGDELTYRLTTLFSKELFAKFDCSEAMEVPPTSGSATCTIEPVNCLCEYPHPGSGICWCSKCAACRQGTDDNIIGYRVVISGLQDTGSTANCPGSELNGTYDFDWPWDIFEDEPADPTEGDGYDNSAGCPGRYIFESIGCACGNDLRLSFRILPPAINQAARIEFAITRGPFYVNGIIWQKELDYLDGELIDCMLDGEELDASHIIALEQCPAGSGTTFADPSGATITITALTS